MRPQMEPQRKTNITSLAATATVVALVAWMTSLATHHGSLYAPVAYAPSPAGAAAGR